jgi:hypothetical protein
MRIEHWCVEAIERVAGRSAKLHRAGYCGGRAFQMACPTMNELSTFAACHSKQRMRIFGIDPDEDRLRIRALRATPVGRASHDPARRQVFSAALGQFDELLTAAASVGPASRPLPLYYALNQAGRAIVAALQLADRPWRPYLHGLSIRASEDGFLQQTAISKQRTSDEKPGSFQLLAEAINEPPLTKKTTISSVWAAIPGLDEPGLGAGCPRALPLEFDSHLPNPAFARLRRLQGLPAREESKARLETYLERTYPRARGGLIVESVSYDGPNAVQAELAWKTEDGQWRPVWTAASRYLSPTNLWLIPALSSGDCLPPILLWWCLLQALSSLARYHPGEWTAALDPDQSVWGVSIEKALLIGLAVVPRLVLVTLSPGAIAVPAG